MDNGYPIIKVENLQPVELEALDFQYCRFFLLPCCWLMQARGLLGVSSQQKALPEGGRLCQSRLIDNTA